MTTLEKQELVRLLNLYRMLRKTPSFSYGDISHTLDFVRLQHGIQL